MHGEHNQNGKHQTLEMRQMANEVMCPFSYKAPVNVDNGGAIAADSAPCAIMHYHACALACASECALIVPSYVQDTANRRTGACTQATQATPRLDASFDVRAISALHYVTQARRALPPQD
jgi:hypothetical protein